MQCVIPALNDSIDGIVSLPLFIYSIALVGDTLHWVVAYSIKANRY